MSFYLILLILPVLVDGTSVPTCSVGQKRWQDNFRQECIEKGNSVPYWVYIGCKKPNGNAAPKDTTWNDNGFIFKCLIENDGLSVATEIIACMSDGQKLEIGKSTVDENGRKKKCVQENNGNTKLDDLGIQTCSRGGGPPIHIDEELKSASKEYMLECVRNQDKTKLILQKITCLDGNERKLRVGREKDIDGTIYRCTKNDEGLPLLEIEEPRVCRFKGEEYELGEEKESESENYIIKCVPNGNDKQRWKKIACLDVNGNKLNMGKERTIKGTTYSCTNEDGMAKLVKEHHQCENRYNEKLYNHNQKFREGSYQFLCYIADGEAKFSLVKCFQTDSNNKEHAIEKGDSKVIENTEVMCKQNGTHAFMRYKGASRK